MVDYKLDIRLDDIDVAIASMPSVVYKYRAFSDLFHKKLLFEQELYFASANQLNDPFDASLPFNYNLTQLTPENIFLKHCELIRWYSPNLGETEVHERAFEAQREGLIFDEAHQDKFQKQLNYDVNRTFGIVSLSQIPNDILMWSHYSDSHKGFCVGLDLKYIFKNFGPKLHVSEMNYQTEIPQIDLFEDKVVYFIKLLATKSKHWQYEKEVRIIQRDYARKVLHITKAAVKEVYLGARMDQKLKFQVVEDVLKIYGDKVSVFDCSLSKTRFEVNYNRIA
jgi:hypothetical protein